MRKIARSALDRVQCPICSWTCLHHGKRSDGLRVSWRTPADQPASDDANDKSFIRQFAQMRFHARGHFSDVAEGKVDAERVHLALAFVPNFRKKINGETDEERKVERKKRRLVQARESGMRYRKRLKKEREEAKLREVCATVALGRNPLIASRKRSTTLPTGPETP